MSEYNYNSQNTPILLREYGRNAQDIVNYICSLPDKTKRTQYAYTLVSLLKQLNPSLKEGTDSNQRIWDSLYVMSDFRLDVDGPYEKPSPELFAKAPEKVPYPAKEIRFKYYGRNIELLLKEAMQVSDHDMLLRALVHVARLMKIYYVEWNRNNVEDDVIIADVKTLTKDEAPIEEALSRYPNMFDLRISTQQVYDGKSVVKKAFAPTRYTQETSGKSGKTQGFHSKKRYYKKSR